MKLTIAGIDVSSETIYSVSMSTGRDDIYSQPDGSSFSADLIGFEGAGAIGDEIVLSDEIGQIFRGWITDIKTELQPDMSWETSITATGPLAVLGQLFSGISAYPVETDSERVQRIVDETAMGDMLLIDVAVEGPLLATRQEATHPENAAELARLAADSGMGVFWEQPNSYEKPLRYTQAKYRTWDAYAPTWGELPPNAAWSRANLQWDEVDSDVLPVSNTPPALALDPADVFADLVFEQTLSDLIRTVQVSYGPTDSEETQPSVVAGDGEAPSKSFTTIIEELGEAIKFANEILGRHEFPSWRLSSMTIDLALLSIPEQIEIRNALQVGARVTITMPHGSPVGEVWQGFLEGWSFDIEGDGDGRSFIVEMNISDRFMTEPADRWMEIGTSVLWEAVPDNVRWTDATDVSGWAGAVV